MISLNSLAAFAQEVARNRPAQGPARPEAPQAPTTNTPVQQAQARRQPPEAALAQRMLETVPPPPPRPLPRGSLLDLRA